MKKRITLIFTVLAGIQISVAQYALTYSGGENGVFFAAPGTSVDINYTYTSDIDQNAQFQIFNTPVPEIFTAEPQQAQDAEITFSQPMLTAGTDVAGVFTITVPEMTTLSEDLEDGRTYRIFGKLANDEAFWSVDGVYPELRVVDEATLSTNEFTKTGTSWYVSGSDLVVNGNFSGKSLQIFDISGRLLNTQAIKGSENRIDISNLNTGIYLLTSEKGSAKFVYTR